MTTRDDIARVLIEFGVTPMGTDTPDYGIHGWRCAYYEHLPVESGGGPCTHFADLVDAILDLTVLTEGGNPR